MPAVLRKIEERKFKSVWVLTPELECERWYQRLDKIEASKAKWHGIQPDEEHDFFVDDKGHPCGKMPINWWIVRCVA